MALSDETKRQIADELAEAIHKAANRTADIARECQGIDMAHYRIEVNTLTGGVFIHLGDEGLKIDD